MPSDEVLLDYSNRQLKKVPKFDDVDKQNVNALLLDSNELQKIENIDSFMRVEKVLRSNETFIINNANRNIYLTVVHE